MLVQIPIPDIGWRAAKPAESVNLAGGMVLNQRPRSAYRLTILMQRPMLGMVQQIGLRIGPLRICDRRH
jgi:hypothetical protein